MSSIRLFLTASVIAIIVLANFLAAIKGYQSSMQKSDEIFDKKLLHSAKLLSSFLTKKKNSIIQSGLVNKQSLLIPKRNEISKDLIYRVTDKNGFVIEQSNVFFSKALSVSDTRDVQSEYEDIYSRWHYDWVNFNGYRWRKIELSSRQSLNNILLMEKQSDRFILAETVILESIYPILFAIPSIALLIFFIVGKGLKPLRDLSTELNNRRANNLATIHLNDAPKELHELTDDLNHLLKRLDHALIREKRFSADAAHELRTPITALNLQISNLTNNINSIADLNDISKKNLYDSMYDLGSGIQRMSHLIEQILTLNQFSIDDYCNSFKAIDINKVLRQCVADVYPLFSDKKQTIELLVNDANFKIQSANKTVNKIANKNSHLNKEEQFLINGDYHGLVCLFSNILENANKYTPPGGDIRIIVSRHSDEICISIIDSGQGISNKDKERLFDRFYRAGGDTHQSNIIGCGLGLSIVKEIALRHNAEIEVFSKDQALNKIQQSLLKIYDIQFPVGLWFNLSFLAVKSELINEKE